MNVTMYTKSTCHFCNEAKAFLTSKKVPFTEINVEKNSKAVREMVEKSGQIGVPVIDVNGTIVVGFDRVELRKALRL
ncbi:MAG: glutaredoxin family protein [Candidatus Aenigmarchaeota archaeon]|nr:glutaredoxin family protein [Candidatus Aenigmarchaeota archaeon]